VAPINVGAVCRSALLEAGDIVGAAASHFVQALLVLLLVAGALASLGPTVMSALIGFLLAQVLVSAGVLARCVQRGMLRVSVHGATMAGLLRFGVQAHVGTVALFLTYRLDLLVVNYLLGPGAAGVYSIALTLSEILRVLPEAGQMAIYSHRTAEGQLAAVVPVARTVLLSTTMVSVATAAVGYWLIPVVFGAPFAGASAALVALVPGLAGLAVSYAVSPVLVLRGRIRANSVMASLSLALMIGLDWLVIPRWGLVGAAGVSSLAYGTLALLQVLLVKREETFLLRDLVPRGSDLSAAWSNLLDLTGIARLMRNPGAGSS
jgi:O-antigen/teichoic acid export membrane protein